MLKISLNHSGNRLVCLVVITMLRSQLFSYQILLQEERGGMEPLPRVFDMWKAFDLLNKMRCILRVEAQFEARDDTNSGRQTKSFVIGRTRSSSSPGRTSLYGGSLYRGSIV